MTTNLSNAAKRRLAREGTTEASVFKYRILDPSHKPDLNGEFAHAKVQRDADGDFVMLTEAQAKFYLASASIEKVI